MTDKEFKNIENCDFLEFVKAVDNIENNANVANKEPEETKDVKTVKKDLKFIIFLLWLAGCSILFYLITNSIIVPIFIIIICLLYQNKLQKLPYQNYHILGYITFLFLIYVLVDSWNSKFEYEYYDILRWLVMIFSGWTSYKIYKIMPASKWLLIFSTFAILYNPIIKISLEKDVWQIINIITAILILIYAIKSIKK